MTPEELSMRLDTPVLRDLDGRERINLVRSIEDPATPTADRTMWVRLSDGERALLRQCSAIVAIKARCMDYDRALQDDVHQALVALANHCDPEPF